MTWKREAWLGDLFDGFHVTADLRGLAVMICSTVFQGVPEHVRRFLMA
jgi:hypothetical protein